MDNPSLMTVLAGGSPEKGNLRETFFYNQMRVGDDVLASKVSDFQTGDHTFESGGRKKGKKQIESVPKGVIVKDDIAFGHDNVLTLWQFGFNY